MTKQLRHIEKARHRLLDRYPIGLDDPGAGDKNHIPPWHREVAERPHGLAQKALDAIPHDRFADPFAHRKPEP